MKDRMKNMMKSSVLTVTLAALLQLCASPSAGAQAQPAPQTVAIDFPKKIETYLRELFALGPSVAIKIGNPAPAPLLGLVHVDVELTSGGQSNTVPFYATPDARFIVRGDIFDSTTDPFATNRSKIRTENYPSRGPANTPVTVVEYADFQCPSCRQMNAVMKQVLLKYPQVRFIFKDLPLAQIHPWAMTAATAARCAYTQSPEAFWKMHDSFYTNQELITPTDVWTTSIRFAKEAGLDEQTFKVCMTSQEAKTPIEASVNEARALNIANTPTSFVNGRRVVGPDAEALEQYIRYELAKVKPVPGVAAPPPKKQP